MTTRLIFLALSIAIAIAVCAPQAASALYFLVTETDKKCFLEELPSDTVVKGKRKAD